MICTSFRSARALVVFAALALAIQAAPARTEEVIFPPGSRVGLVPPPGMVVSKTFDGFADPAKDAAILIAVLPAGAFAQIEKVLDTDALKKQGVTVEKREPMQLSFGKGILLDRPAGRRKSALPEMASGRLRQRSDRDGDRSGPRPGRQPIRIAALRAALATLAVRAKVPEAEELEPAALRGRRPCRIPCR